MTHRVLIADDEAGMRLLLRKAIEKHPDFAVCAQAQNGEETLEAFEKQRPDVVFLDVEMPVLDGIETARRLQDTSPDTPIVFVTAHEAYRSEAFEVYAADYLVKPFSIERLDATLERLSRWIAVRAAAKTLPAPEGLPKLSRILIKGRDEAVMLSYDEIVMVKREDRQSVICTRDGAQIAPRDALSELEERLPRDKFFRCHKSYIINLDYICHIYPYGRWTYVTRLRGTKFDALITRERYEMLEQMIR